MKGVVLPLAIPLAGALVPPLVLAQSWRRSAVPVAPGAQLAQSLDLLHVACRGLWGNRCAKP
jgi:hypothetical protein